MKQQAKSQYIPEDKRPQDLSLLMRIRLWLYPRSWYVGNLKIQFDKMGNGSYKLGVSLWPQYKQFEINVGRFVLNFWYRG